MHRRHFYTKLAGNSAYLACGKAVEKMTKSFAQTSQLSTPVHNILLDILQNSSLKLFLNPAFTQAGAASTQPFPVGSHLLNSIFYPLSPTLNDANELNKGFYL